MGLGLTQRRLANEADVAAEHLCAIERGQLEPSRKLLKRISAVLGVGEPELFLQTIILTEDAGPIDRQALISLTRAVRALRGRGVDAVIKRGIGSKSRNH